MSTLDDTKIVAAIEDDIIAISMILSTTDCDEPCNAIITVTWQNTYHAPINFKPGITVNGKLTTLSQIRLDKNKTVTKTFNLNNLMEGIYTICPYPN